mmetsp:Transcript_44314/g.65756  ORF Transcript_44314/g.65756 Transcript_44314/m.65756 type:complete len:220 (-) Transcript_44314:193-852(-)
MGKRAATNNQQQHQEYKNFVIMVKLSLLVGAIAAVSSVSAFAPPGQQSRTPFLAQPLTATALPGSEVDSTGNNIAVKDLLLSVEDSGLLTKVASSGLLSKAQKAGISLSKLEPLLMLASENKDVLVLVEASGPEVLKLLPTVLALAPPALPLLGAAISIPAVAIQAAGLGALGVAGAAVTLIPDDTVVQVAEQTLIVGLMLPLAVLSVVGGGILGSLTK